MYARLTFPPAQHYQPLASHYDSILRYRSLHSSTLANLTRYAFGAVRSYDRLMIGIDWLKLLIANAAPESQEQVCRILYHASIQPLGMQYALGQKTWTTDLFDLFPRLNIYNLNSLNTKRTYG